MRNVEKALKTSACVTFYTSFTGINENVKFF